MRKYSREEREAAQTVIVFESRLPCMKRMKRSEVDAISGIAAPGQPEATKARPLSVLFGWPGRREGKLHTQAGERGRVDTSGHAGEPRLSDRRAFAKRHT